jgi:hypothetical protein
VIFAHATGKLDRLSAREAATNRRSPSGRASTSVRHRSS